MRDAHERRAGASPSSACIGELLITAGVVTLLYVVWQLWIGDVIYGAERNATGQELVADWAERVRAGSGRRSPTPTESPAEPVTASRVDPARSRPTARRSASCASRGSAPTTRVPMAGGVTRDGTLDPHRHRALPRHARCPARSATSPSPPTARRRGKPFNRIAELHVNDAIVIETDDGWYTYRFRTLEYVTPDEVEVLLPVPQAEDVAGRHRYITMTSCSPMYSMTERIVAYGVFESFTPRAAGEPAPLTEAGGLMYARTLASPSRALVGAGAHPASSWSPRCSTACSSTLFPWVSQFVNPQEVTVE